MSSVVPARLHASIDHGSLHAAPPSLPGVADALFAVWLSGVVLASLLPLLGGLHWMVGNINSAALQLFGAGLLCACAALTQRRWKTGTAAIAASLLQASQIAPHLGTDAPYAAGAHGAHGTPDTQAPSVTWLVANVNAENTHHEDLVQLVRERSPDLIGLTETDRRWVDAMDAALTEYPHRVVFAREDYFGIALYSRLPLKHAGLRALGLTPSIGATIDVGGREVDLLLIHVTPPLNGALVAARNSQLRAVGQTRPRPGAGLVVAGDFNTAPFSRVFRESFIEQGFRRSGALVGTWPAALPGALRLPIDHALVAGPVQVQSDAQRPIHSDHVPLRIRISAAPDPAAVASRR